MIVFYKLIMNYDNAMDKIPLAKMPNNFCSLSTKSSIAN